MNFTCKLCATAIVVELSPHQTWWECPKCQYTWTWRKGDGLHIKWEVETEDLCATLNLFPQLKKSVVWVCKREEIFDLMSAHIQTVEIPYLVQNIRPDNVKNKIKYLLTFS